MRKILKRGYVILEGTLRSGTADNRITYRSKRWKIWRATITLTTCYYCASMNGRVLDKDDPCFDEFPVHDNCRCYIEAVIAVVAGSATSAGMYGVDLFVFNHGKLPENYLGKKMAQKSGWEPLKGKLAEVLPGMMIGGDRYKNRDGRLPDALGRMCMKQTLITQADTEMTAACCILMMVSFLLLTIIILLFTKLDWR